MPGHVPSIETATLVVCEGEDSKGLRTHPSRMVRGIGRVMRDGITLSALCHDRHPQAP